MTSHEILRRYWLEEPIPHSADMFVDSSYKKWLDVNLMKKQG